MTIKLTIYIPSYNRHDKLKNCLNCIAKEMIGFEHSVLVYVSNNCSTDNTREYLESLDYPWLQVKHNDRNLGANGNITYGFYLPVQSEFIWMIGDDDYLMPGSISGILSLIEQYPETDYIFCNTKAFSADQSKEILEKFLDTGVVDGGIVKSRKYVGTALVPFEKMIDPTIADTLLGELMCNCFRQSAVSFPDQGSNVDFDNVDWEIIDFDSAGRFYQPHILPFLHSFTAETKAVYCDVVRTFNFWGTAEWLGNYDYVFPIVILFLISQYQKRGFISHDKFLDLLNYFFTAMKEALTRQATGKSGARPFNPAIKAEMFNFLVIHLYSKA